MLFRSPAGEVREVHGVDGTLGAPAGEVREVHCVDGTLGAPAGEVREVHCVNGNLGAPAGEVPGVHRVVPVCGGGPPEPAAGDSHRAPGVRRREHLRRHRSQLVHPLHGHTRQVHPLHGHRGQVHPLHGHMGQVHPLHGLRYTCIRYLFSFVFYSVEGVNEKRFKLNQPFLCLCSLIIIVITVLSLEQIIIRITTTNIIIFPHPKNKLKRYKIQ